MVAEAKINPEIMKWARKRAGFIHEYEEDLPKDIKSKYELWEKGEKYPTWNQLRNVSKKYNVPTAFFFLENIPNDDDNIPKLINYRKINDNLFSKRKSPNLISNIRKAEVKRGIYLDLLDEMNREIISFEVFDKPLDKFKFSNYIRKTLDISLANQESWFKNNISNDYNHYNFLDNWKSLLNEKFGILVFETQDVAIEEMRGLCIFHENVPIIILNGKDSVNGRIFSIFHELAHLLCGESAICDNNEELDEEIFCNSVAGEFLVPTDDLNKAIKAELNISDSLLSSLSNKYGVSKHVILRRLLDINFISSNVYNSQVSLMESSNSKSKKVSGGSFINNKIKYDGKPYYTLIVDAYYSGIINISDFTEYTNLNQK